MVKKNTTFREWKKAFLLALFFVLLLRIFVFEVFTVPSTSMEKTILTGDFVLVNKLAYGSRLPITPLSIPFFHQYLNKKKKKFQLTFLGSAFLIFVYPATQILKEMMCWFLIIP